MTATFDRGYNALKKVLDAPIASFFSSCVHCGLCAEACMFYTENGDPKYTPIHKLEPLRRVWEQETTLVGKLAKATGLAKKVDDQMLEAWSPLVYDSCSLCGRCSLVCPVGNDITYMVRKLREGMAASGNAPEGLIGASKRTITVGSPMGVQWKAVAAQIKHVQADTGLTVPVDQENADYLVLMSSMEIINYPEYLAALARIFHQAKASWTVSTEAYEATNSGIQIGSSDIAKQIVERIVNAAEKLKVKTAISPECGHAFTALRWEGPNLIGRPYKFKVQHILEVLDDLRAQGRLKTKGEKKIPVTFHDPCQIARRGGVIEQPRRLLGMVAPDLHEMADHGQWNWCCSGGGGVSANDRAETIKLKAFKLKKAQIEETGVKTVVTACANCRITLEEGIEHYEMPVTVLGLTELIAEYLVEDAPAGDAAAPTQSAGA